MPLKIEHILSTKKPKDHVWKMITQNQYVFQYMGCMLKMKGNDMEWYMEKDGQRVTLLTGHILSKKDQEELIVETYNPHREYDQKHTLKVSYIITEKDDTTELKIIQEGFEDLPDTQDVYEENQKGWNYAINALKKLL